MATPNAYPAFRVDEPTTLAQFLDFYRHEIVEKVADLTDEEASAHVLPATRMTAGGIVKHLALVEDRWFQDKLLGRPLPEPWASAPLEADRDWPFHSSAADSVGVLIDLYEAACERSRAAAGEVGDLAAQAKEPSFDKGPVSLRWLLVHMIEETARHAGHLDLLCDAINAAR